MPSSSRPPRPLQRSTSTRGFIAYFLLFSVPLLLLSYTAIWTIYHVHNGARQQHLALVNMLTLQAMQATVKERVRDLRSTLLLLAANPSLAAAIEDPGGRAGQQVAGQWLQFSTEKRLYDQMRLIDLEGRERLRVNLSDDKAWLVPRERLQNKAGRYYFREAMQLPMGSTYVSPLDLNIENGAIEQPYKPMLRIGTPVADDNGRKVGLLLVNFKAKPMLDRLRAHDPLLGSELLLLNRDGYYLLGPTPEREWGFMFADKQEFTFARDFPSVWETMQEHRQGQLHTQRGLFTYHTIDFDSGRPQERPYQRRFHLVSVVTPAHLDALESDDWHTAWFGTAASGIIILIGASFFAWYRRREELAIARLKRSETQQRLILQSVDEGIFGLDTHGRVTFANRQTRHLTGYTEAEVLGKSAQELFSYRRENGSPYPAQQDPMAVSYRDGQSHFNDSDLFCDRDQDAFPVQYNSTPIVEDGVLRGAVVSFSDISSRLAAEREIRKLAHFDPLTDLPNRNYFLKELTERVAGAEHTARGGALLYMDLDHFKQVNDSLGHDAGDTVLREVARRLRKVAGDDGFVARIGSDQFAILACQVDDEELRVQKALELAGTVATAVRQPLPLATDTLRITVSIGVAIYPDGDDTAIQVLRKADTAAGVAKQDGRNTTRLFALPMEQANREWLMIYNRLQHALNNRSFTLVYQPKVDSDANPRGVEALLRWHDPMLGQVSPARFIPIAEATGLILPIGDFVLNSACDQAKRWREQGMAERWGPSP